MDILISGAGIAGPTLAWWLQEFGHRPMLVEAAPKLRTGGYIIDFWGKGFDIAGKMGLGPELAEKGYHVREVRFVGREGQRRGGFPVSVFDRVTKGRYISLPRGELAAAIGRAAMERSEARFGDSILSLEDDGGKVHVTFEQGDPGSFDLVIGADGVHSAVRDIAFGPESRFETFLGYKFAAFVAPDYAPRETGVYICYSEPGMQAARFAMRDGSTLILLVYADGSGAEIPGDLEGQKRMLAVRFGGAGWECRAMMEALDRSGELYMDRVSQIHLPCWSKGRVALVGDAAYCPSLLAGQGSALAMIGAYVLAGELKRAGDDHALAFSRYEERLSGFMRNKQKVAARFASSFAPRTWAGIGFRNLVSRAMAIPLVADWAIGGSLSDDVDVPDY